MSAKSELIERLKYINEASALPPLIDNSLDLTSEHNQIANLLRKGLSIVAFNILEDFIKKRTLEALDEIANSGMPFNNLPEALKEASITKALSSLQFQATLHKNDGQDHRLLIQTETKKIASTLLPSFELSQYSFVSSSSNVTNAEISDLTKAFGISGGWTKLKNISDNIGGGVLDLSQAYTLAAKRRNKSAHSAAFRYDSSWLQSLKNEILAIAASIDISLKSKCRQAVRNPLIPLIENNLDYELNFRFLEYDNSVYKDKKTLTSKSIKNWNSISKAKLKYTSNYLFDNKLHIIIIDTTRRIKEWL